MRNLIPAWEKQARELVARRPEHRNRIAVWARRDDAEAIMPLFGGRITTFCRVFDHTWHGGAVKPPMMYFSEAQTLGTISRSGAQPRISFALGDKNFATTAGSTLSILLPRSRSALAYSVTNTLPSVLPIVPELNEFAARAMYVHYNKLRVEPERLGVIVDAADADVSITALPVADLFESIFDLAGFAAKRLQSLRALCGRAGSVERTRLSWCSRKGGRTGLWRFLPRMVDSEAVERADHRVEGGRRQGIAAVGGADWVAWS